MKMAVVSMEEPSGGTSPPRQRAGTETPVPQILASRWRRLSKVSCTVDFFVPSFQVDGLLIGEEAASEGRRGGDTIGWRGPHPGRAGLWSGGPVAPLWSFPGVLEASWKNRNLGLDFVQFREYFLTRISETKNSRKQELTLRHLVNRLVPENARI